MRLIVTRHGKAERDSRSGLDSDRVLRERGHRQAEFLGRTFASFDEPPTLIVSSPYARAWQTAERISSALGLDPEQEDMLSCTFGLREALDVARACVRRAPAACIVGHNPTFEGVVEVLTATHAFRLRTGEAAIIEIKSSDALLDTAHDPVGVGELVDVIRLAEDD